MERSMYWYTGILRILTNTYTTTPCETSCKESVIPSLFYRVKSIVVNKDDLTKESTRINQLLKENGYQESIITKIFKRITNNHSFSQS